MAISGMSTAASGLDAMTTQINVIANNIANANSIAFKGSQLVTSDIFYDTLIQSGINESANAGKRPVGVEIGIGTKVDGVYRILIQGEVEKTDNKLDVALTAPGYIQITMPDGTNSYTRAGNFQIDPDTQQLVTVQGYPLSAGITIPGGVDPSQITIARDGTVTATVAGVSQQIGVIPLYTFANEKGLQQTGDSLLLQTDGSGEAAIAENTSNAFLQGYLEKSNVSPVKEMTKLIAAQRNYDLLTRILKTANEVEKSVAAAAA